jgi:ribosomal peptide maturation radical SAM protein 1
MPPPDGLVAAPGDGATVDVVLVSMPFAALYRPSLALGLLAAELRRRGHTSRCLHFTIPFAERIGQRLYVELANQVPRPTDQVGEWLFAPALFGPQTAEVEERYVDAVLRRRDRCYREAPGASGADPVPEEWIARVRALRPLATAFVDECAEQVLALSPRLVGLTSVFQQHVASLALAARLKAARPDLVVVIGGDNCEATMGAETARQFVFLDAVVSGEGEIVLPEIVRRVKAGESLDGLPGVFRGGEDHLAAPPRDQSAGAYTAAPAVPSMDALPAPDFDEFLAAIEASTLDKRVPVQLLFEGSRGCWWGEKSHCTFCGLNSQSMGYRAKSPERAMAELADIAARHPGATVSAVDNILDMRWFRDVVPALAKLAVPLDLFYEIKANLRHEHVRLLAEAGIRSVQPGIESFSDQVLSTMGKGVRGLQNVQLLKWCLEHRVRPYWNLLWGFPGEDPAEYARMAAMVPLLSHLQPPDSAGSIRLDRFSPNFERPAEHGFADVRPFPAYHHVYPFAPDVVAHLAYYFTYDYAEPRDLAGYTAPLLAATRRWSREHATSALFFLDTGERLEVWDLRPVAVDLLTIVGGVERELFLALDAMAGGGRLAEVAARALGRPVETEEVSARLAPLVERGLVLRDGDSYLALPVAVGNYRPPAEILARCRSARAPQAVAAAGG